MAIKYNILETNGNKKTVSFYDDEDDSFVPIIREVNITEPYNRNIKAVATTLEYRKKNGII